ncbi:MAG: hypothetical protein Ct9H300mP14_12940 [Gammaproteobacteria bacterium]|nr:MAG: hypothetical protein Ct9H300mP14_12940 [Gammaproteobacteria bacterium]
MLRVRDVGVLSPQLVHDYEDDWLGAVTSTGRLFGICVGRSASMSKGKGVKIINFRVPGTNRVKRNWLL